MNTQESKFEKLYRLIFEHDEPKNQLPKGKEIVMCKNCIATLRKRHADVQVLRRASVWDTCDTDENTGEDLCLCQVCDQPQPQRVSYICEL